MLSSLLHKHIDAMDEIEQIASVNIDNIMKAIDIKELIDDPQGSMQEVSLRIKEIMEDKLIAMATKEGFDLAKTIARLDETGKALKVDTSKDPTKNKEIVN